MDAKIHVWRCDGCGEMLPGPDLDLDTAECKCRTGQWRVCSVAATIGESTERARKAEQERDSLAAANLAANKRIVELERERDEWMRRAEGWESEAAIATERFNRLAAAQPGEPLDMDCGGQTDSLRQMAAEIVSLRKRLSDLTTPRPIAEAPTDKPVLGIWIDHRGNKCVEVLRWDGRWRGALGTPLYREAEYLPLPEVKP